MNEKFRQALKNDPKARKAKQNDKIQNKQKSEVEVGDDPIQLPGWCYDDGRETMIVVKGVQVGGCSSRS